MSRPVPRTARDDDPRLRPPGRPLRPAACLCWREARSNDAFLERRRRRAARIESRAGRGTARPARAPRREAHGQVAPRLLLPRSGWSRTGSRCGALADLKPRSIVDGVPRRRYARPCLWPAAQLASWCLPFLSWPGSSARWTSGGRGQGPQRARGGCSDTAGRAQATHCARRIPLRPGPTSKPAADRRGRDGRLPATDRGGRAVPLGGSAGWPCHGL